MENTDTDMWAGRSEMNCSESGRGNTTWRQGHHEKERKAQVSWEQARIEEAEQRDRGRIQSDTNVKHRASVGLQMCNSTRQHCNYLSAAVM